MIFLDDNLYIVCFPFHVALTDFDHRWISIIVCVTPFSIIFIKRIINWSSLSIYYQALRDKTVFMGIGTWYKYANRLDIKRKFFRIKRKKVIGIRASRPLQILHMDVTIFKPLDNTKVYIYFIVDNFSRAILNWQQVLNSQVRLP